MNLFLLILFLGKLGITRAQTSKDSPNIVFVLLDDLRWDAMGFTNKYPFLETPNIDKLRKEGVLFKNSFCTHSLCAPSRATFLTGTFSQVHGVNSNQEGREFNPDKTPSFPQILQKNGYKTAFIGKWHMGRTDAPRKGFDYWYSFNGQGNYYGNDLNINGEIKRNEGYITDELNKYAIEFIKDSKDKQPFCLYLSHKAVHQPFTPPIRDEKLYEDSLVPKPAGWEDDMADKPSWQRLYPTLEQRRRLRSKELDEIKIIKSRNPGAWPAKKGKGKQKDYLRCISAVDDGLGKIYDLLEEKGILDNTIIVFSSDNGYFHGEHGKGDKRLAYNESMRIPLIMRYPKLIKEGDSISEIVLNADIAPTFLDIANVSIPDHMQGKSIIPLLKDTHQNWRDSFLFTYWPDLKQFIPRIVAVRTKDYLYSTTPDIKDIDELYDLQNDPAELNNLIENAEFKTVKDQLEEELERLKKETLYKANVPRPNPAPKLNVKKGKLYSLKCIKLSRENKTKKNNQTNKTCSNFTRKSAIQIPFSSHLNPALGTFIVDCEIKTNLPNGVIASFGNNRDGWALFIEDGKPGFVVAHDGYLQFVDGTSDIEGDWYHLTAVIKNYHNNISLYGNGDLLEQRQMLLPIRSAKGNRDIHIGLDPGAIDPEGFSQHHFDGLIRSLKFYRKELTHSELKKLSSK